MRYRYPMEFAINGPNVAFLIGVLHAWRYYQRSRRRELESAQLAAELNRARLERLEAQLQPHFLFNTLNAISSLMYRDPEAADRMLGRLSDLLRLTFARTPDPEAPLHSELEWLGWYLELDAAPFRRAAHHPAGDPGEKRSTSRCPGSFCSLWWRMRSVMAPRNERVRPK